MTSATQNNIVESVEVLKIDGMVDKIRRKQINAQQLRAKGWDDLAKEWGKFGKIELQVARARVGKSWLKKCDERDAQEERDKQKDIETTEARAALIEASKETRKAEAMAEYKAADPCGWAKVFGMDKSG